MSVVIAYVTPTYNSETFLNAAIASVVLQRGNFHIRYHIQDGGSTDRKALIVEGWKQRIDNQFPLHCNGIDLTFDSRPDSGMYQAINRGFDAVRPHDCSLMGWIGSDDVLATGAFAAATAIVREFPEVRWLGGRSAIIDENDANIALAASEPFSRSKLAAGKYVSERFLMQEGTLWHPSLWRSVGGLDESFRYAGDWDLWRRMAALSPYVSVDALFAYFRKRPGQLSGNLAAYLDEMDRPRSVSTPSVDIIDDPSKVHVRYDHVLGRWAYVPPPSAAASVLPEPVPGHQPRVAIISASLSSVSLMRRFVYAFLRAGSFVKRRVLRMPPGGTEPLRLRARYRFLKIGSFVKRVILRLPARKVDPKR